MKVGKYSQLFYKYMYHIFMYLHTKLWFYCFIDRLPWKELPVQFPERPAHLAVLAVLERRFLWCSAAGEIQETCLYKVHIMSTTYSKTYMLIHVLNSANTCPHLTQVIKLSHALNSLKSLAVLYMSYLTQIISLSKTMHWSIKGAVKCMSSTLSRSFARKMHVLSLSRTFACKMHVLSSFKVICP